MQRLSNVPNKKQSSIVFFFGATFWEITGNFLKNLEKLVESPNQNRSSQLKTEATFAVAKRKHEKQKWGLYGIRTLDLCDTGAALYQLS